MPINHQNFWNQFSSQTRKTAWSDLCAFFIWASIEFSLLRLDTLPCPPAQNKPITPFTEEGIKKMLKACERTADSKGSYKFYSLPKRMANRDKALILLFLDTGLRVSEAARLMMRDLNRENGEIILTPFLSGRKSRRRTVYVGQAARKALWRYLTNRSEKRLDGPLIATQNGHEMDRNTIRQLISRIGAQAVVSEFRIFLGNKKSHLLRGHGGSFG